MEQSIITWNIPNFITVVLMVLLAGAVMGVATKAIATRQA